MATSSAARLNEEASHAPWRPADLADALRARTTEPRIVRNGDGVEVLKTRMGEEPLAQRRRDGPGARSATSPLA